MPRVCSFTLTSLFILPSPNLLPQPSYGSMPAGSDHYQNHQPGYSIPPSRGTNSAVDGARAQRGDGRKERDGPDVHVPRGPVPPMAFTGQPVGQYPFDIASGMRNLQVSHDKIVSNSQNRTNTGAKVRLGMKITLHSKCSHLRPILPHTDIHSGNYCVGSGFLSPNYSFCPPPLFYLP